jgi:hypothetical protein
VDCNNLNKGSLVMFTSDLWRLDKLVKVFDMLSISAKPQSSASCKAMTAIVRNEVYMKEELGRRMMKLCEDPGTRDLSFNILGANSYKHFFITNPLLESQSQQFSASNKYIFGAIHHDAGSQVRIGECRISGGALSAKRALIEEGASKVPLPSPPANATTG